MPGYAEHAIFDDAARARAYRAELEGDPAPTFSRSDTCFATAGTFRVPEEHDPRPLDWDTFSADRFTAQTYPGDGTRKVVPVRAERWSEAGGTVRIKSTVFWVDLRSGGTKLIASSEVEPARVASPFEGVSVYALRTGPTSVAFFVRRDLPAHPRATPGEPLALFGAIPLARSRGEAIDVRELRTSVEGDVHTSACAFERVDLELRTDPALSEVAAPIAKHVKAPPSLRKGFKPFFGSVRPAESVNVVFATVVGFDLDPIEGRAPERSLMSFGGNGLAEVRPLVVNFGLARATDGGAPIPSVSYRWLDRSRPLLF
jgi:hypothetical protein